LQELAKERGQSLAQMALSWVLRDQVITSVLIGASKPEQILDNIGALNNCTFTQQELAFIDSQSL
jgi:L-glyceraldehyde 3-phosphate reductase